MPHPYPHDVRSLLGTYSGRAVYFEPLSFGNNGDKLIELGARHVLHHAGVHLVDSMSKCEVIVMNGGGSMTDLYRGGIDTLRAISQRYGHIPLIILPQSYHFARTDFASLLRGRTASTTLFARERYSLEFLNGVHFESDVSVRTDHDMAFALSDESYIRDLHGRRRNQHLLVVERMDAEAVTDAASRVRPLRGHRWINGLVPRDVKRRLRWHFRGKRWATVEGLQTGFARQATPVLRTLQTAGTGPLPVISADISAKEMFSFSRFETMITDSGAVATTRLHVGILSAMLGIPTVFAVGSGAYKKIRGVFEYSLQGASHVHLLEV